MLEPALGGISTQARVEQPKYLFFGFISWYS
jgi:hypothetical protein